MYEHGFFLSAGDRVPGYYDDMLTEAEVDLVCGVYKIETGKWTFNLVLIN